MPIEKVLQATGPHPTHPKKDKKGGEMWDEREQQRKYIVPHVSGGGHGQHRDLNGHHHPNASSASAFNYGYDHTVSNY